MSDKFSEYVESLQSPPSHAFTAAPNDTADLPNASRCINVASAGAVRITTVAGDTATLYVAAGIAFPIRARRIHATGTTASGIVVMY